MKKACDLIKAFALLAIILYDAFALITAIRNAFLEANPQFSDAVLKPFSSIVVVSATVFGNKVLERQSAVAKDLRDKKSPVYCF